ncbi:MAG: hypothetical protein ABR564_08530 [Candidatus Dormibacteria bacterium]
MSRNRGRPPLIAVCGAGQADDRARADAHEVGRLLAEAGAVMVCGGLGGVMAAAAEGVRQAGGVSVGLLPGWDPDEAAEALSIALPTGLAEMRNGLIVRVTRAVVAIAGGHGTLSEIALALRLGRPVAMLDSWELRRRVGEAADPGVHRAGTPAEAVGWVLAATR